MYFDSFPVIFYDSSGDLIFKDVTNLLRRVGLRTKVRTNSLLYDTYNVKEGETPEMIAHKLYGDTELHWIILLVNEVTDRYHQWPMTTPQFLDFINDKYDNPDGIHHYETTQTSGDIYFFGSPSSYKICSDTVNLFTRPPVFSGFVISNVPSSLI